MNVAPTREAGGAKYRRTVEAVKNLPPSGSTKADFADDINTTRNWGQLRSADDRLGLSFAQEIARLDPTIEYTG